MTLEEFAARHLAPDHNAIAEDLMRANELFDGISPPTLWQRMTRRPRQALNRIRRAVAVLRGEDECS